MRGCKENVEKTFKLDNMSKGRYGASGLYTLGLNRVSCVEHPQTHARIHPQLSTGVGGTLT
jgi:hypothetical protein